MNHTTFCQDNFIVKIIEFINNEKTESNGRTTFCKLLHITELANNNKLDYIEGKPNRTLLLATNRTSFYAGIIQNLLELIF